MTDSSLVMRIDARSHPSLRYLNKLSGIRYSAIFEVIDTYKLSPIFGRPKHITDKELANAEVWERLP